jgi:hypothetical protein
MPVVAAEPDLSGLLRARRILILGSPGAGKSHLAGALSPHVGMPLIRHDDHLWKPGPVRLPPDEWRARVVGLTRQPEWIMDGTYEASLDLRLPAAEAIVYIESNRWACLWRVVRRRMLGRWGRTEASPGHALTAFFVRYVLQFSKVTRPEVLRLVAAHAKGTPLVVLDGARGIDRTVRRLEQRAAHAGIGAGTAPHPAELQRDGQA